MKRSFSWVLGMLALGVPGVLGAAEPAGPAASAPAAAAEAPAGACVVFADNGCCGNSCCNGRILAGVGVYYMQPFFENNPAFTVSRLPGTRAIESLVERTDITHDMELAPLVWLGYADPSGLGARGRFWHFDQETTQGLAVPAATGADVILLAAAAPLGFPSFVDNAGRAAAIGVGSKLELHVLDLEGVDDVELCGWNLLLCGGVRVAQIDQTYNAFLTGDSGGAVAGPVTNTMISFHRFRGLGPVVALEARKPLADSGLSVYGSARGALLFGSGKQEAIEIFSGGGENAGDFTRDHRNRVMPVGELELGVEYSQIMGPSRAFGQLALVGQDWFAAGSASRSAQLNFFGIPGAGGSIIDSDLGFFGVVVRVGVDY